MLNFVNAKLLRRNKADGWGGTTSCTGTAVWEWGEDGVGMTSVPVVPVQLSSKAVYLSGCRDKHNWLQRNLIPAVTAVKPLRRDVWRLRFCSHTRGIVTC